MKKNKFLISIVSLILCAAVIFTGCTQKQEEKEPKKTAAETTEETSTMLVQTEKSSEPDSDVQTQSSSSAEKQTESDSKKSDGKNGSETSSDNQKTNAEKNSESTSGTSKTKGTTKATTKPTTKATTKPTTQPSTKPPEVKPAETSFFDDAVFVGDSVTLGLRNYATSERNKGNACLGKAQFLAAGSMGYTNTMLAFSDAEAIHPKYKGKTVWIEDGVKEIGAKKVFIMLGMNDFCAYKQETGISNAEKCIKKIVEKNPGVKIYIQSVTPTARNSGRFNNTNIASFNTALKSMCQNNGWTYVDVASIMKDSNGNLKSDYCSDPEGRAVHMTYSGCKAWVNYLNKTFA